MERRNNPLSNKSDRTSRSQTESLSSDAPSSRSQHSTRNSSLIGTCMNPKVWEAQRVSTDEPSSSRSDILRIDDQMHTSRYIQMEDIPLNYEDQTHWCIQGNILKVFESGNDQLKQKTVQTLHERGSYTAEAKYTAMVIGLLAQHDDKIHMQMRDTLLDEKASEDRRRFAAIVLGFAKNEEITEELATIFLDDKISPRVISHVATGLGFAKPDKYITNEMMKRVQNNQYEDYISSYIVKAIASSQPDESTIHAMLQKYFNAHDSLRQSLAEALLLANPSADIKDKFKKIFCNEKSSPVQSSIELCENIARGFVLAESNPDAFNKMLKLIINNKGRYIERSGSVSAHSEQNILDEMMRRLASKYSYKKVLADIAGRIVLANHDRSKIDQSLLQEIHNYNYIDYNYIDINNALIILNNAPATSSLEKVEIKAEQDEQYMTYREVIRRERKIRLEEQKKFEPTLKQIQEDLTKAQQEREQALELLRKELLRSALQNLDLDSPITVESFKEESEQSEREEQEKLSPEEQQLKSEIEKLSQPYTAFEAILNLQKKSEEWRYAGEKENHPSQVLKSLREILIHDLTKLYHRTKPDYTRQGLERVPIAQMFDNQLQDQVPNQVYEEVMERIQEDLFKTRRKK
jgi:hypothetical protein